MKPTENPRSQQPPTIARSWASLAQALGINRRVLQRIRKLHPDHPKPSPGGAFKVKAWQEFLDGLKQADPTTTNEPDLTDKERKLRLEVEKLGEAIRKARVENDEREGKLYPRVDVERTIISALSGARSLLVRKMVNEWPFVMAGRTAPEIAERMKIEEQQIHDEMRKMLASIPQS